MFIGGSNLWNKLPNNIRNEDELSDFMELFTDYLGNKDNNQEIRNYYQI